MCDNLLNCPNSCSFNAENCASAELLRWSHQIYAAEASAWPSWWMRIRWIRWVQVQQNAVVIMVKVCQRQTKLACSPLDADVCIYVVSRSSLGALGVSVSVTVSDIQSSVLQISSGSHRENTRHGRRDPVATWTVWASQPALSYVAQQIWPLVLSWPVYAQISSIWGQKGGKGIPVHTLLKGTIGVVNICISLQNAQKTTKAITTASSFQTWSLLGCWCK